MLISCLKTWKQTKIKRKTIRKQLETEQQNRNTKSNSTTHNTRLAWIFNTKSKMCYDIMPQNCGPCCWFMSNCQTSSVIVPQSRPRGLLDSASVHSKRQNWFNSRSIWVSFPFPYWWSFPRVGWLRLGDHYTVPRRDQPSATFLKTLGSVFFTTQP